jgi:aminoglycoside phosphotransferase family enzyme
MAAAAPYAGPVPLDAKVAFLRQPRSYPESTTRVEAVETHMSWVFLTELHAYKLKKPVCHDELDARTVQQRRFYCEEELRLNRRLAARIYLAVLPLTLDPQGHLQLGGTGEAVDWLVKMQRLPAALMLDHALAAGVASEESMLPVMELLAAFYLACPPVVIAPAAYRRRLGAAMAENRICLGAPAYRLQGGMLASIFINLQAFLQTQSLMLDERVRHGHIVEGHGDLRAEHVYLGPPPAVIDCLEFSRTLRTADSADEICFLALECERLGNPALGEALLQRYAALTGETPPPLLTCFYRALRATTRATLSIRHLDEEKFRYSPEGRRRANDYLALAERHAAMSVSGPG